MIGLFETDFTIVTVWRNDKHPPRYYALLSDGTETRWSYSYEEAERLGKELVDAKRKEEDVRDYSD